MLSSATDFLPRTDMANVIKSFLIGTDSQPLSSDMLFCHTWSVVEKHWSMLELDAEMFIKVLTLVPLHVIL